MSIRMKIVGRIPVAVALVSIILASCGYEREDEERGPARMLKLDDTPILTIGSRAEEEDGEVEDHLIMHRIAGGKRLADGSVVVALQGSAEIRKYGPDGNHIWTTGRTGQGPRDFQRPRILETCSSEDGITVYDEALWRVTKLDEKGNLVTTWNLPFSGNPPYQATCAPDGRMIYHGAGAFPSEPGRIRWRVPVVWAENNFNVHILRDSVPAHERIFDGEGETASYMDQPWSRQLILGGTGQGVWIGTGDDYLMELIGWNGGSPIATARWTGRDLTATPEDEEQNLEEIVSGMEDERREKYIRESWPEWQELLPSRVPAYSRLIVSSTGTAWVESWEGEWWLSRLQGHPGTEWNGFDESGAWIGQVKIPATMSPLDFGEDWVLVRTKDEWGVERLAVFGLTERE